MRKVVAFRLSLGRRNKVRCSVAEALPELRDTAVEVAVVDIALVATGHWPERHGCCLVRHLP